MSPRGILIQASEVIGVTSISLVAPLQFITSQ